MSSETIAAALRHLIDAAGPDEANPSPDGLTDEILLIARDNTELLNAVQMMADGESQQFHRAALVGMAVTYSVLRTQMEVNALEEGLAS